MDATWSVTTPSLSKAGPKGSAALASDRSAGHDALRDRVGEFVGNVFYGTLLRQLQGSQLKGKYFHGGRGEEVFRGQLNMELAKRMGQSVGDPIAEKMYAAFKRAGESKSLGEGSKATEKDSATLAATARKADAARWQDAAVRFGGALTGRGDGVTSDLGILNGLR